MLKPTGTPCKECPFRRTSAKGWLGGHTPEEFAEVSAGDGHVACHMTTARSVEQEMIEDDDDDEVDDRMATACSGRAIFLSNLCKMPRDPTVPKLPRDTNLVFANRQQFLDHHTL